MKKVLLMIMLLFIIFPICYAESNAEQIILTPEQAGVIEHKGENPYIHTIEVKDPYENMNTLEIALANKTSVIWMVVGIVIVYLVIVVVVLKLTKRRWK